MGTTKNVDMSMTEVEVKVVADTTADDQTTEQADAAAEDSAPAAAPKKRRTRSAKYTAVRAQVDKTRQYDPFSAIELIKRLSYSAFPGTITAHVILKEKEAGTTVSVQFPHSTGQSLTVEIADEDTLKKLEAGQIDFDVLLATPAMMGKLSKYAPVLGPRGLMPNPKVGTLLEQPETKKKELESGKITLRAERKAPLMHVVIGNTELETKQLQENLQALVTALKGKISRVSLAATMSPSVKVELSE